MNNSTEHQQTKASEFVFEVNEKKITNTTKFLNFQIDSDGSGSIDFDEFVKIMT